MAMNVSVNQAMVTTAFELPGYRVTKNLGLVRGVTVRSRSIFGTMGASLQTLIGGNITLFEDMCEQTRQQALDLMMEHAVERGGNAVVGGGYDPTARPFRRSPHHSGMTDPRTRRYNTRGELLGRPE